MRASKIFSFIFGIMGTALMLLTVMLSLTSLDGKVMGDVPKEAAQTAEQLMAALADGDYVTAETLLYGDSRIGDPREAATKLGRDVWIAYSESFVYEFTSDCYGSANGLSRDVVITTMDITSISDSMQHRGKDLLASTEKNAEEGNNAELVYNEDGTIRESVMEEIMETAVAGALTDATTRTTKLTLELVNEAGNWQVVPSAELLKAVSGGL